MSSTKTSIVNDALIKEIRDAVQSIDYGQVQIIVQDNKIIQVEVTRRNRYDDIWRLEGGAGI